MAMNFRDASIASQRFNMNGLNVTGDGRVVAPQMNQPSNPIEQRTQMSSMPSEGRAGSTSRVANGVPLSMDDARARADKSGYNGARYLTPEESAERAKTQQQEMMKKYPWMRDVMDKGTRLDSPSNDGPQYQ